MEKTVTFNYKKADRIPKMMYKILTDSHGKRGDVKLFKGLLPPGWDILTEPKFEQLKAEAEYKIENAETLDA